MRVEVTVGRLRVTLCCVKPLPQPMLRFLVDLSETTGFEDAKGIHGVVIRKSVAGQLVHILERQHVTVTVPLYLFLIPGY